VRPPAGFSYVTEITASAGFLRNDETGCNTIERGDLAMRADHSELKQLSAIELELCDLPLLTAVPVRDLWLFSRKLRTLRLARCSLLPDKAFPSAVDATNESDTEKPLPPTPITWLEDLPPLILRHTAENLRILDLGYCTKITDDAIAGIVAHAPKIQSLVLSGCVALTDKALESICKLGDNLDTLMMAHITNITDPAIVNLTRSCGNLRSADFACKRSFPAVNM